jgi:TonB-linked SusC/RagA family outer membrane protein
MLQRLLLTGAFFLGVLLSVFVFDASIAFAQTGAVTGTVEDAETGETIPGANVQIVELQRGTATDPDGAYEIGNVPVGTHTLRVTFVGYQAFEASIEIEADETLTRNVALESGAIGLDELVVTGYSTRRRADLTGSVSSVSSEDIRDVPVQNPEQLLQGRAAGVTVAATSGNPGSGFEVTIRGEGSINGGNDPLYIVDGVPMSFQQNSELTDRSPLNAINPSDIQSIEVLKDAAAAAIYGAQAANGVVLITTKSGREGQTDISLNFEGGIRFQSRRFDLMERDEWIDFQVDAFGEESFRNDILPAFGYEPETPFNEVQNFDWQDWLFEPGSHTRASFSASGGDESTQFFLSGNWSTTGGALQADAVDYDQFGFRTNLTQRFTDDLTVDARVSVSNQDQQGVCQDGFFINCPFYQSIGEEPPISFPFLDNGEYNPNTEQSATTNPALVLNEETREVATTQILGNISPTYRITDWLSARGNASLDWQRLKENDYGTPTAAPSEGGELSRRFNTVTNLTLNGTLNARRTFAEVHDVDALIGTEYRREYAEDEETGYQGFNNPFLRIPDGASETSFFQGFNTEYRILSYFGQTNYTYDNRYILTLTGRYDGSSRFGAGQRWGFFPSGAVAWRISNEDFFNVDIVDDLKLRVSYGITGSSDFRPRTDPLRNFRPRGLFDVSGSYEGQVGFRPDQLANRQLTWEEKRETNVAVDWSMWKGRFTGSVDVYRSNTEDLLLDRPLPLSSGFGAITENIGRVQNQGIELSFRTVNLQTEDFFWSTRFNISVSQNTVKELSEGVEELDSGDSVPIAVGRSLEAWKVPIWAGVNPADGRPLYYDADGNLTYEPDEADDQFFDGGEEDAVGGFGTQLGYKGLSLDVFFDYSYGATALPNTQRTWTSAFGEGVLGELTDRRWREAGDIASWPRATPFASFDGALDPDALTSLWLYRANYLRLKNVSLSYRLPTRLVERVRLGGVRVYVSGINLAQWSSYLGIDPEVADGFEESSYPAEQQFNFGIELNL